MDSEPYDLVCVQMSVCWMRLENIVDFGAPTERSLIALTIKYISSPRIIIS